MLKLLQRLVEILTLFMGGSFPTVRLFEQIWACLGNGDSESVGAFFVSRAFTSVLST